MDYIETINGLLYMTDWDANRDFVAQVIVELIEDGELYEDNRVLLDEDEEMSSFVDHLLKERQY